MIAGIAAIGSFVAGAFLLVLVGLGLWHARKAEQSDARPAPAQALQPA